MLSAIHVNNTKTIYYKLIFKSIYILGFLFHYLQVVKHAELIITQFKSCKKQKQPSLN